MLRSVKLRVIVPPLVVIFPVDFLGREFVRLLFPSGEHFQSSAASLFLSLLTFKQISPSDSLTVRP